MGIKRVGNWTGARTVTEQLEGEIDKFAKKLLRDTAVKGERMSVKFLRDQSLSWKPLSSSYKQSKISQGDSEKILIKTSQYLQSINSRVDGNEAFIGVLRTVMSEDGMSYADIAAALEYGVKSKNLPARPLWQVVEKHLYMWAKKHGDLRSLVNELKKKGGN